MERSEFFRKLSFFGAFAVLPGFVSTCSRNHEPDIQLNPEIRNLAETLKGQFEKIRDIAENPGQKIFIGLADVETVSLSLVDGGPVSYRHPVLEKSNGDLAHIIFGIEGGLPSIKFTDSSGETIVKDGRELEFGFSRFDLDDLSSDQWIELGIKLTALGLAIWIGANIVKAVFAALAFLAFIAFIAGLLILGINFAGDIIEFFFDFSGIDLDDVIDIFQRAVDRIVILLEEIRFFIS